MSIRENASSEESVRKKFLRVMLISMLEDQELHKVRDVNSGRFGSAQHGTEVCSHGRLPGEVSGTQRSRYRIVNSGTLALHPHAYSSGFPLFARQSCCGVLPSSPRKETIEISRIEYINQEYFYISIGWRRRSGRPPDRKVDG